MSKPPGNMRKAQIQDVEAIHALLFGPGERGEILPRTRMDLYGYLRDYFVWTEPEGKVIATVGLHIIWEDLAEIRSLVVAEDWRSRQIGRHLVEACLDEAIMLGLRQVFVLTYRPTFFAEQRFREVDKAVLPHKIWFDCVRCAKFPQCDEVAMIIDLEEA